METRGIPVILDTDIGTDIDDTWALAMLLGCPELDLKLVTTATGDTEYRARLAARFLEVAGRADVPVGVGVPTVMKDDHRNQAPWVAGYELRHYPGRVHADGAGALADVIRRSPEPVTVIAIGPLSTVAAALVRDPEIAGRARFVGMHGSIAWSHHGAGGVIAEYNVKHDIAACQAVFAAPWKKVITPLDTCGRVRLTGEKYRAVAESADPLARAVIANYEVWKVSGGWVKTPGESSILFDCVAVYLAFADALLDVRRMTLAVTDDGFTREDPAGADIRVAMAWKDLAAFEDLIVGRLTGGVVR
ncbi:MAG: nucleoside hydrolase [Planctomycetota bacterium]